MSQLTTCSNHGGHSQQSSICALRERHQDLKDQEPQCYRSSGVLLIELTLIMLKGCGKNLLNKYFTANGLQTNFHPRPDSPLHLPTEETCIGKVVKKRTAKRSKQLVDEFIDEGVPTAKPSLEDTEEAILQKVLEESLTDAYPTQRGPLPLVVIREPDTGKLQPLPEVPGKGKEKVGEEQAAQRHTLVPSEPAGHEESSSLYAELGLYGSDTESDEDMPSVVRSGTQDEGQAGPNPDDVAESQPLPTPSVLTGPNLEQLELLRSMIRLVMTKRTCPALQGRIVSLQHPPPKPFSFGDQFLNGKPSEADMRKTTSDTELESIVLFHCPSESIIIKRICELEEFIAKSMEENQALETRLDKGRGRAGSISCGDIDREGGRLRETIKEVWTIIRSIQVGKQGCSEAPSYLHAGVN
ncbi:hypothetical protein Tco_0251532 [Tanacetum coccineum]